MPLPGQTYAMNDNGTMKYFLTDHLGSTVAVTDASGTLLEESRYLPFGQVRSDVGNITQTDKTYTGQKDIANTGLMDYNARMYSPELGRFIQPDTIVPGATNSQAWNRFSYTQNNPVNNIDPSGHMRLKDGSMSCDTAQCKAEKEQILQDIKKSATPTATNTPTSTSTSTPTPTPTTTPTLPGQTCNYIPCNPTSTYLPTNTPTYSAIYQSITATQIPSEPKLPFGTTDIFAGLREMFGV